MDDGGVSRETVGLPPWSSLSAVEQSLVRGGLRRRSVAGLIQAHGMALRWSGADEAPLKGGYTYAEQRELVPLFAAAAVRLAARGVLTVRRASQGSGPEDTDQTLTHAELERVLRDPVLWIWDAREQARLWLDASEAAHEQWYRPAYFAMARPGYPAWSDMSEPEHAILLSAAEASGMLTGLFGIWSQPDPALSAAQRLAAVDELLAPLLPFVRDGLLEVQYRADARSDAYTVVAYDELRSAFTGTEIWRDDDADFSEGACAVFTLAGYATWHDPSPSS